MKLSKDQEEAKEKILEWYENGSEMLFTLGGLAGSGKTFLIKALEEELEKRELSGIKIAHCAFTGKAADVMRRKGINNARTIHNLIYKPIERENGKIEFVRVPSYDLDYKLIVVDEASMVSKDIFEDLMSYNKKVLFVGDYGQLDPVESKFNLMEEDKLDYKLTTIHRQALDNPIITLSLKIRDGYDIDFGNYGNSFYKTWASNVQMRSFLNADQVICGTNKRRKELNELFREKKGYTGLPKIGEKLIILRNNMRKGVFNGQQVFVESNFSEYNVEELIGNFKDPYEDYSKTDQIFYKTNFQDTGFKINEKYQKESILADYGYAISVHKSQGSEWDKVLLIDDERFLCWDQESRIKWLYTAFTRAKSKFIWAYGF